MNNDLISRSALLGRVKPLQEDDGRSAVLIGDARKIIRAFVMSAPAVDAVEVVHGYWENANSRPKTYIRKCSVCGKEAYFCGIGCSYKFCPNCGAIMDGDFT